jgi:predicted short-subunit dehydrogenase-like oxidoreductase (DUF2520 family)
MTRRDRDDPGICIIGAGRVGCNLARWLTSRSIRITALVSPHPDTVPGCVAQLRPMITANRVGDIPNDVRIVFICSPDGVIRDLASELAAVLPDDPSVFVAHTSGLRTAAELEVLRLKGLLAGSFHPIQSFPSKEIALDAMSGIGVGVEGDDRFAERAEDIARLLGWQPVRVPTEYKASYHAACVFAGNFLPVIAAEAIRVLRECTGTDAASSLLLPMMRHVLTMLESENIESVLTGPAIRGDADAIAAHLRALAPSRHHTAALYAACTQYIVSSAHPPDDVRARMETALRSLILTGDT